MLVAAPEEDGGFACWLADGLGQLPQQERVQAFRGGEPLLQLVVDLRRAGLRVQLESEYKDALETYAKEVMHGDARLPEGTVDSWPILLDVVGVGGIRGDFRIKLIEAACNCEGAIGSGFFAAFGEEIADAGVLKGTPRLIPRLLDPLLKAQDREGVGWLRDVIVRCPEVVNTAEEGSLAFKNRLNRSLSATGIPEDVLQLIREIAEHLGIDVPVSDAGDTGQEATPTATSEGNGAPESTEPGESSGTNEGGEQQA